MCSQETSSPLFAWARLWTMDSKVNLIASISPACGPFPLENPCTPNKRSMLTAVIHLDFIENLEQSPGTRRVTALNFVLVQEKSNPLFSAWKRGSQRGRSATVNYHYRFSDPVSEHPLRFMHFQLVLVSVLWHYAGLRRTLGTLAMLSSYPDPDYVASLLPSNVCLQKSYPPIRHMSCRPSQHSTSTGSDLTSAAEIRSGHKTKISSGNTKV